VPKPILDGAGVVASVGQGVAEAMPQHVAMNREIKAGAPTDALDQPIGGVWRERTAALGREDVARVRDLPVELAQRPDLVAAYARMSAIVHGGYSTKIPTATKPADIVSPLSCQSGNREAA